jgi:two-component system CheB/CheR fusion protein
VEFGKAVLAAPGLPKMVSQTRREHDLTTEIQREADRLILSRLAPSGVIVDTHLQVLHFRGQTGLYLEHASGEASLNLLQMAKPALTVDLRASIHKAIKQDAPVRVEGILMPVNGSSRAVDIDVLPFRLPGGIGDRWLLVLFHNRPAPTAMELAIGSGGGKRGSKGRNDVIERLRDELRATKESLQAIIEEQEATNEELKSANEEIESSNEELQSSNEELETAKEELQSTNEELQTLNEELNTRNAEMAQINDDLGNLLSSINLAIVMVDNDLTVRRATPLGERLFNLIPADIGRRLSDIKSKLKIVDIDRLIRMVIDTLETQEREVEDTDGRSYSMRIRPYRTKDDKISGAVITLVDIDTIKRPPRHT